MTAYRAILIAGPTASGKSAWALRLAARHNGVVVNADSMQVYRDLAILTARPSPADLALVPHALYGHVDGGSAYSAGRWIEDVGRVVADCRDSGRLPIIVGGTGLYFKALLDGLSPIPQIPAAIRDHWREEARRLGPAALHDLLAVRDPETAARLRPTDPQRLTRALEVMEATGRGLADWHRERARPIIDERDVLRFVVSVERQSLAARAGSRLDAMIAAGALEEAHSLARRHYSPEQPVMRALGVAPLIAAAEGRITLAEAIEVAKRDTRHYIKRQETWLRRNMMSWDWVMPTFSERNSLENFTFAQS